MSCGYKQQNGYDGAHRELNHTGLQFMEANLSPRFDRHCGTMRIILPRDFTTDMTP
jgi:hypothetical protein